MVRLAPQSNIATYGLTILALLAFAANSILCRAALKGGEIDPVGFTLVRLLSGALVLAILLGFTGRLKDSQIGSQKDRVWAGSWLAALMLFAYALAFSFAYVSLDTGTGALILFGSVQMTIILIDVFSGNRLGIIEWFGIACASAGLVYLVYPDLSTPSALGFVLMVTAGVAWGVYTVIGRNSNNPLADTTFNFVRCLPLLIVLALISLSATRFSLNGVLLAVLSGALASGIGYAIWYAALRGLKSTESAVVQLAVPVIAASGGIVFLSEAFSQRFFIASLIILGGILTVILGRRV